MDASEFDDDAAAMAQAMGFSSFGAQDDHPSKKRRYNPRADASTDMPATLPSAARPSPATGANADEISLNDDDEDSTAPQGTALAYVQTQIDEMIKNNAGGGADSSTAQPPAGGHGVGNGFSLPNRPNPSWGTQMGSPPQPSERGGHDRGRGRRGGGHGQHQHGAGGESGKPWYDGYYDTRSNENPWQQLEKDAGLQPLGSWGVGATGSG